jgi:hypothetical protein
MDAAEPAARQAPESFGSDEPRLRRDRSPRLERERVRHPRIPAIDVVLDDDERGARAEMSGKPLDDRRLVGPRDEVKAVRSDDPVERRQLEGPGEVRGHRLERGRGESRGGRSRVLPEGGSIPVDCEDPGTRPEEVGEGEGERTGPRTDVRPRPAGVLDPGPEEADVIAVIHPAQPVF